MDAKKVDWLKRLQILLKALEKKGVKTDMWMEIESKALGYELDFSEHDNVFEDKIAELENIINHQLGDWDKHGITYQEILDMKAENDLLKQRIAELESKETEKLTKLNLNDRVKVKLTPLGAEIYYHQYDEVNKRIKENGGTELEPIMPQIDKDGYTKFQLWHFIELYGEHIGMCKPNVISSLDIIIAE